MRCHLHGFPDQFALEQVINFFEETVWCRGCLVGACINRIPAAVSLGRLAGPGWRYLALVPFKLGYLSSVREDYCSESWKMYIHKIPQISLLYMIFFVCPVFFSPSWSDTYHIPHILCDLDSRMGESYILLFPEMGGIFIRFHHPDGPSY